MNTDMHSSLAILLPEENFSYDTNRSMDSAADGYRDKIGEQLQRPCSDFIQALTERDFSGMARIGTHFIDQDFQAQIDDLTAMSLADYIQNLRRVMESSPEMRCNLVDTALYVDDISGHAAVHQLIESVGRPNEPRRLAFCMVQWRRKNKKWSVYRSTTVRGFPGTRLSFGM